MFKLLFLICLFSASLLTTAAQTNKTTVRLPITAYLNKANDSITIVQVKLPAFSVFTIEEKTLGVLHPVYKSSAVYDSGMIGYGRCNLIKGDYFYFTIKTMSDKVPEEKDLLTLSVQIPKCFPGLLYNASRNHILFTTVEDKEFYNWQAPFLLQSDTAEEKFFKMMQSDIHYTAAAMVKQMPESNVVVKGGLYDKQKLFDAMQKVDTKDVKEFLKYVNARPKKYAGNTWKISEIFATWMVNETPTVIE